MKWNNRKKLLIDSFPGIYNIEATREPDPVSVCHDDIDGIAGIVIGEGLELSEGHSGELKRI